MEIVSSTYAKAHFNELLKKINGENKKLAITSHGKVVAYLTPSHTERKFELAKNKGVAFPHGWDDPMTEEELTSWYDSTIFPHH